MQTYPAEFHNPHSRRNQAGRLLWDVAHALLFRPTPWFMRRWRAWLLRRFGARLGGVAVDGSARGWAPGRLAAGDEVYVDRDVNLYNVFGITVGDRVVISQGAFLCSATHDYRDP